MRNILSILFALTGLPVLGCERSTSFAVLDQATAREAGLAALDCGESELAVRYCIAAVEIAPNDAGLICNLSLAYMLAGDDPAAMPRRRCNTQQTLPIELLTMKYAKLCYDSSKTWRQENALDQKPYRTLSQTERPQNNLPHTNPTKLLRLVATNFAEGL